MIRKLTANKPLFIGTIFLLAVVIGTIVVYLLKPEATGFNEQIGPMLHQYQQYQSGKKLWDWLQLIIIPAVLVIGGFWLNHIQKTRDDEALVERQEREHEAAAQRAKIADNNQYQATLQAYIDKLSAFILENQLLDSKRKDKVSTIASVQTLTVLSHLDEERKKRVIQFLYGLKLIGKDNCIIELSGADLKKVDLSYAILNDTDLSGAFLTGAFLTGTTLNRTNLSGADLSRADLSYAELRETNLSGTIMSGTNLNGAYLNGAYLVDANLRNADLIDADLYKANLSGANLRNANLRGANLRETNLSDVDLSSTKQSGFKLIRAKKLTDLGSADLSDGDLSDANLSGANLSGTDLSGANLSRANLSGATLSVTIETLEKEARSLQHTIMPDGKTHS